MNLDSDEIPVILWLKLSMFPKLIDRSKFKQETNTRHRRNICTFAVVGEMAMHDSFRFTQQRARANIKHENQLKYG